MVNVPCYSCRGKLSCGRANCPIYYSNKVMFKVVEGLKEDFFGSSPPSVFVGSKLRYPAVNVGILSPPEKVENAWVFDAQNYWSKENFGIKEIINMRASLINSRFRSNVYEVRNEGKFLALAREIGMAMKPVDVEIELKKKIKLNLDFDNVNLPMGPRGQLKKVKITENPKIPMKVDKVVSDNDLKAADAVKYLYENEFDEHSLSKLLSIGVLGLRKGRKLVPTRWSITSIDDMLGKELKSRIQYYNEVEEHMLYFGHFMGNYYLIMYFPDAVSYELFEMYLPRSAWNPSEQIRVASDYESCYGRKSYASETVGGYYASRLSVLEHLNKIKRKASVLVFRFETADYWASLGVWVVRSAARKTLETKPLIFKDKEKMLEYAKNLVRENFRYDLGYLYKRSKLLENMKQKKISEFFS